MDRTDERLELDNRAKARNEDEDGMRRERNVVLHDKEKFS